MPLVSKTVEVAASAESIMAIVADFESYPLWNDEIKGCWVLARYDDGRPSQLRLDVVVQGQAGTFITAVYYPGENQIYTVLQQGEFFEKQEQKFSVVPIGATSLLTVDLDVETKLPIPKHDGEEGDRRHAGLSGRQPQGARRAAGRQPVALLRRRTACAARQLQSPISSSRVTNRCAASVNSPLVSRTTVSTSWRRNASISSRWPATAAAPHAASLA